MTVLPNNALNLTKGAWWRPSQVNAVFGGQKSVGPSRL
jgi:hypothetical protein